VRGAPSIGATEILTRLDLDIRKLVGELDPALSPRLLQFASLHLLRTIPYARTEETVAFAIRAAARLLDVEP
jgi:hypothetical protein